MAGELIELPFPPATLSGHNTGHWRAKSAIVKQHRYWARLATLAACVPVPDDGDIRLSVTFYPPDKRGDREIWALYPSTRRALADDHACPAIYRVID